MSFSAQDARARLEPWLRKIRRRAVLFTLVLEPFLILRKGRRQWRKLLSLWGMYSRGPRRDSVWIHAFGLGEMRVAIALVSALPQDVTVVITSHGLGQQLARQVLGDRVQLTFLPLFFRFAVRRFLRRYSPRQLILVEATDLRPLVCLHILRQELPTALVNGWFNQQWLADDPCVPLLDRVRVFGVRGEEDRERLAGTGISRERIFLTGDMKFDATADPLPELEAQIRELVGELPILIAGSTQPDEDPQILDAFERLGGGDRAMLILAPRLSCDGAERLLLDRGLGFVRRSRFPVSLRPAVVLLDSMGELASLYRLAAAAFVGYSLTPGGRGHNPIEPARFAVPIAVGPNMLHFQLYADLFDRASAWQRVADAGELARAWAAWLDAPELARQMGRRAAGVVELQRGLAVARTLELLRPLLGLDDGVTEPAALRIGRRS